MSSAFLIVYLPIAANVSRWIFVNADPFLRAMLSVNAFPWQILRNVYMVPARTDAALLRICASAIQDSATIFWRIGVSEMMEIIRL